MKTKICQSNCDREATHWLESEKIDLCDICTEHHLRFELEGIPERIVITEYNKNFEYEKEPEVYDPEPYDEDMQQMKHDG